MNRDLNFTPYTACVYVFFSSANGIFINHVRNKISVKLPKQNSLGCFLWLQGNTNRNPYKTPPRGTGFLCWQLYPQSLEYVLGTLLELMKDIPRHICLNVPNRVSRGPGEGLFSECLGPGFPRRGSRRTFLLLGSVFSLCWLFVLMVPRWWRWWFNNNNNNNNNYYYNGNGTLYDLLCANHCSNPLTYFHPLNTHISL